ncbi:syntaxin-2 isoform X2 [Gadus macrocephalus]|uniref:syntaxin-2 isoform X2 n=1 Tax=Gadus macrocephalus TaxID=80720 RepID=UPI0028CB83C5|nr:syntaxin-2 isoform X2 [Gadus macrocephalus]
MELKHQRDVWFSKVSSGLFFFLLKNTGDVSMWLKFWLFYFAKYISSLVPMRVLAPFSGIFTIIIIIIIIIFLLLIISIISFPILQLRIKLQFPNSMEHIRPAGRVTTNEELEDMLECGNPSIFTSNIISDSQITRQALNEIESRHQDIIRLEASIRELRTMFMDMALMVETQGDMVNNIEKNVSTAAEYIGMAKEETKKAVRYQKKSRRKFVFLAFAILILIAVVALIVGLSVGLTKPPA